jgi:hypothetical protein
LTAAHVKKKPNNESYRKLLLTKPIAMKQILLLVAFTAFASLTYAQNKKVQKQTTAYAITSPQKGQSGWTEVRLVDVETGQELKSVYKPTNEVEILNARTGKPIVKKDVNTLANNAKTTLVVDAPKDVTVKKFGAKDKLELDQKTFEASVKTSANGNGNTNLATTPKVAVVKHSFRSVQSDRPFATSSAAMAYDKKHERLYYTPMNINQLRYIDLKSGKIYYFEDEPLGPLQGRGDVQNQITRMVIASDGNGYALTNDANHLIQFTTGKKPTITDLGALTDDVANGNASVHSSSRYGGDMIADANKNLYLIGADRTVFKISLETRVATYLGRIKGLPAGFSTNAAIAEGGSSVIVASSTSTVGYYRFDLNTLQAEKVSNGESVFNASDLANGTLAFEKQKKKKERKPEEIKDVVVEQPIKEDITKNEITEKKNPAILHNSISIYPNPVTDGVFRLSFSDQPAGKYQIQLLDVAGKVVSTREVVINNKVQVEEFRVPSLLAKGNSIVNKLVVQ